MCATANKRGSGAYFNATNKNWKSSKTLQFVKLYKFSSCLWNSKHRNYKNQSARLAAYIALAKQFGMNMNDVKAKIKNLRATYFQEVRKINDMKRIGENYRPTLMWFDEMESFVKNRSVNAVARIGADEGQSAYESEMYAKPLAESVVVKDEPLNELSDSESTAFKPPSPKPEYCIDEEELQTSNSLPAAIYEQVDSDMTRDYLEDEFDIFGKHVACQIRQLTLYRALKVQAKIQSLLSTERMKDIRGKNRTSSICSVVSEHNFGVDMSDDSIAPGLQSPDANNVLFQPVDDSALEEYAHIHSDS